MDCPTCSKPIASLGQQTVFDTRPFKGGIRRRRKCNHCAHRFTTIEQLQEKAEMEAMTITRDHISAILAKLDAQKGATP